MHYIRLLNTSIGQITPYAPHRILLKTYSNGNIQWVRLVKEFKSIKIAKQWMNTYFDTIIKQYQLTKGDNNESAGIRTRN